MAIKDVTNEVAVMREEKQRNERIDNLSPTKSAFIIKSLVIAGHVRPSVIDNALNLADTIHD